MKRIKENEKYLRGEAYYCGEGVQQDTAQAKRFFRYALDEDYWPAAYKLGLCYEDEDNVENALFYMGIGDKHHVEEATEWLADHYLEKEDLLLATQYCSRCHAGSNVDKKLIRIAEKQCEEISATDFFKIEESIENFEECWRLTRDHLPLLHQALSSLRNQLLDTLAGSLVRYAGMDDVCESIIDFINAKPNRRIRGLEDALERYYFAAILAVINTADSYEDFEKCRKYLEKIPEEFHWNIEPRIRYAKAVLALKKKPITHDDSQYVKACLNSSSKHYANLGERLLMERVNRLLAEEDLKEVDNYVQFGLLGAAYVQNYLRDKKKKVAETPSVVQIDPFEKALSLFKASPTESTFIRCFMEGWKKRETKALVGLLFEAKKARISVDYIYEKLGDRFLKDLAPYIPKEYYLEDVSKIRSEIRRRGITKLIHFSPVSNVQSILSNGLLSRSEMQRMGIDFEFTDDIRRDGFSDAICLSISDLNWMMLWSKDVRAVEVFEIDPEILLDMPECAVYCNCNAAKGNAEEHMRMGYKGFSSMFSSEDLETPNPIDVQAEILFRGKIDKRYIMNHYCRRVHNGHKNRFLC